MRLRGVHIADVCGCNYDDAGWQGGVLIFH